MVVKDWRNYQRLVKSLSPEEKDKIIFDLTRRKKDLQNNIWKEYGPEEPELTDYETAIEEIKNVSAKTLPKRKGRLTKAHIDKFIREMFRILKMRVTPLINDKEFSEAFSLLTLIYQQLQSSLGERILDTYKGQSFLEEIQDKILMIYENSGSLELKTQIYAWFLEIAHDTEGIYPLIDPMRLGMKWAEHAIFNRESANLDEADRKVLLSLVPTYERLIDSNLENADNLSAEEWDALDSVIQDTFLILKTLDADEERKKEFFDKYRKIMKAQYLELNEYLRQERYEEILEILRDNEYIAKSSEDYQRYFSNAIISILHFLGRDKEALEEIKKNIESFEQTQPAILFFYKRLLGKVAFEREFNENLSQLATLENVIDEFKHLEPLIDKFHEAEIKDLSFYEVSQILLVLGIVEANEFLAKYLAYIEALAGQTRSQNRAEEIADNLGWLQNHYYLTEESKEAIRRTILKLARWKLYRDAFDKLGIDYK